MRTALLQPSPYRPPSRGPRPLRGHPVLSSLLFVIACSSSSETTTTDPLPPGPPQPPPPTPPDTTGGEEPGPGPVSTPVPLREGESMATIAQPASLEWTP